MPEFIVYPIRRDIASQVRSSRVAPQYGHPVHQELASGTGPCRECLRAFAVAAEDRLLFTYSPFSGSAQTPQPGPVFIHAEPCEPHSGHGYPPGLRGIGVLAQGHRDDGSTSAPRVLAAGAEDRVLDALLSEADVQFVHLRHAEAGCFIARGERVAV